MGSGAIQCQNTNDSIHLPGLFSTLFFFWLLTNKSMNIISKFQWKAKRCIWKQRWIIHKLFQAFIAALTWACWSCCWILPKTSLWASCFLSRSSIVFSNRFLLYRNQDLSKWWWNNVREFLTFLQWCNRFSCSHSAWPLPGPVWPERGQSI